jgi:sRNA-binding carbon storage regulator CsrA
MLVLARKRHEDLIIRHNGEWIATITVTKIDKNGQVKIGCLGKSFDTMFWRREIDTLEGVTDGRISTCAESGRSESDDHSDVQQDVADGNSLGTGNA